jgi:hypothetical protein
MDKSHCRGSDADQGAGIDYQSSAQANAAALVRVSVEDHVEATAANGVIETLAVIPVQKRETPVRQLQGTKPAVQPGSDLVYDFLQPLRRRIAVAQHQMQGGTGKQIKSRCVIHIAAMHYTVCPTCLQQPQRCRYRLLMAVSIANHAENHGGQKLRRSGSVPPFVIFSYLLHPKGCASIIRSKNCQSTRLAMQELITVLLDLGRDLVRLLSILTRLGFDYALLIGWLGWWLWLVDWRQFWPALARGAWLPLLLVLGLISFLAWHLQLPWLADWKPAILAPLTMTVLLFGSILLCGWLQEVFSWHPVEITLQATAPVHHHEHQHHHADHGH